jgi:hypothetical protein
MLGRVISTRSAVIELPESRQAELPEISLTYALLHEVNRSAFDHTVRVVHRRWLQGTRSVPQRGALLRSPIQEMASTMPDSFRHFVRALRSRFSTGINTSNSRK